jgi:hypothetical protein
LKAKVYKSQLELVLKDFVNNNIYRILAIDNDILSFIDAKLNEFPIILVTNPKDSRFLSEYEPFYRILTSTHIRMFIFSPNIINNIKIFIDNKMLNSKPKNVKNSSFWTCSW